MPERPWLRQALVLLCANLALAAAVWGAWEGLSRIRAVVFEEIAVPGPLFSALSLALVVPLGFLTYVGTLRLGRYPDASVLWALPQKVARRLLGRRTTPSGE